MSERSGEWSVLLRIVRRPSERSKGVILSEDINRLLLELHRTAYAQGYNLSGVPEPKITNCPVCGRIVRSPSLRRCSMCGYNFETRETK